MAIPIETDNDRKAEVANLLEQLSYPQLKNLECTCHGNEVVLSGTLHSFYLVQVAQTEAAKVPGIHKVVSRIEIVDDSNIELSEHELSEHDTGSR